MDWTNIRRPQRFRAFTLLLAAALLGVAADAPPPAKPYFARPFTLGAHRGGGALWPENTIEAYQTVAARWPDALLEGDVQLTADGAVVILHDDTVDRTTNGAGRIVEMTLEQVKRLDAGYRFSPDGGKTFPYRGKGITIPLLGEALAACPRSRFLIELKDQPRIAEATVRVLEEAGAVDRVALASFNPALIQKARDLEPNLIRCYDIAEGITMLAALRGTEWSRYRPVADLLAIGKDLIRTFNVQLAELRAIRDKGIPVLVYTINDPETMRAYLDAGVSALLSDRPDLLAEVITRRHATSLK